NTTPASLPSNFGNQTLNACGTTPSCQTNPAIPLQGNAQWQSTLLGQTVTLTLNTRLDPNLPGLVLPSCVSIPAGVLTALDNCGYGRTVAGLLNLANHGLAGQSTCSASLSDINNAINSINTYFNGAANSNCPMCQQYQHWWLVRLNNFGGRYNRTITDPLTNGGLRRKRRSPLCLDLMWKRRAVS